MLDDSEVIDWGAFRLLASISTGYLRVEVSVPELSEGLGDLQDDTLLRVREEAHLVWNLEKVCERIVAGRGDSASERSKRWLVVVSHSEDSAVGVSEGLVLVETGQGDARAVRLQASLMRVVLEA